MGIIHYDAEALKKITIEELDELSGVTGWRERDAMNKKELQERAGILSEADMDAYWEMRSHIDAALRAAHRAHSEYASDLTLLLKKIDGTASGR
jgi:hypothetical protein